MAETQAQEYAARLGDLIDGAVKLPPEVRKAVERLLIDLNKELVADLAAVDPEHYSAARIKAISAQVDRLFTQFSQQATSVAQRIEQQAFSQASSAVVAVVSAGTRTLAVAPVLNAQSLVVVQGYTADLISGLSKNAAAKINAAIQRAYLGRLTLPHLVNQIGSALGGGKFSGLFSETGERALSIATNEVMRVHSVAADARITELATRHAQLMKRWKHMPIAIKPRLQHLLANDQTVKPGEPFLVAGEKLMYPRDPAGSPENTINCHCLELPWLDPAQLKPTDAERELLGRLGVSVTTSRAA